MREIVLVLAVAALAVLAVPLGLSAAEENYTAIGFTDQEVTGVSHVAVLRGQATITSAEGLAVQYLGNEFRSHQTDLLMYSKNRRHNGPGESLEVAHAVRTPARRQLE